MLAIIAVIALPPLVPTMSMALAGFLGGVIAPSRDMLVRNAAPPGAAGRAFGIVSTGVNIGGIISPLLFGWIMDQNMPHWSVRRVGRIHGVDGLARAGHRAPPANQLRTRCRKDLMHS